MKKYNCPFCGTELTSNDLVFKEEYTFNCNICEIMITVNPDKPETERITGRTGESAIDIILRSMRRRIKNEEIPISGFSVR